MPVLVPVPVSVAFVCVSFEVQASTNASLSLRLSASLRLVRLTVQHWQQLELQVEQQGSLESSTTTTKMYGSCQCKLVLVEP